MKNIPSTFKAFLKEGDVVDIIAPSSKCHPSVLNQVRTLLASWKLNCHIPDNLFGKSLLYANSDEIRFQHLENALMNETSKAVWCLLGGYGAIKLLPMLKNLKIPKNPKIFIGFSDITALHIFLQNQWGWVTIHGPSALQVCGNKISPDSIDILKKLLCNEKYPLSYEHIIPLNQLAKDSLQITAPIIGGNLHLIQATLGTPWQINAQNKILFIEEIDERAYRIDRALAQLSHAGILNEASALLFGDLVDKGEPDGRFLVQDLIKEFASQFSLPVFQIKNVGHGFINYPLLLGSPAKLCLEDNHHSLSYERSCF